MATAVAIARILDVLSKLWPFRVVRCYLLASPTAWRTPRMLSTASSHCFAAVENLIAVFRTTSRFVYCCTRSTRPMEAVVGLAGPCVCVSECVSVCVFIFSGFQRLWLLVFSLDSFCGAVKSVSLSPGPHWHTKLSIYSLGQQQCCCTSTCCCCVGYAETKNVGILSKRAVFFCSSWPSFREMFHFHCCCTHQLLLLLQSIWGPPSFFVGLHPTS